MDWSKNYGETVVTVSTPKEVMTQQSLPYFIGISKETTGARGLSMNLVVIPPGAQADCHFHKNFETGIYVLKGEVLTRYGRRLEHSVINKVGDFLFIPPGLPHQPSNCSNTEPAIGVVVRNDPNEQENVVPYEPEA